MNENMRQSTFSNALSTIFSVVAMGTMAPGYVVHAADTHLPANWVPATRSVNSTNSMHVGFFSGLYPLVDNSFSAQFADAYLTFANSQKRMDQDFSEILAANIWDLYAR